jgi:lipopolysaccharide transport system ATP-binding protein
MEMPGQFVKSQCPKRKASGSSDVLDLFQNPAGFRWPVSSAMLNLRKAAQTSNGWARCTAVALCDASGQPCRLFPQGYAASFFYEFLALRDLEVPVGGVLITNDRGVNVHGKHTIQIGTPVPMHVPAGSRIRFRHEIALDLECREYVFQIGLVTLSRDDYERRLSMSPEELEAAYVRVCHVPCVGSFALTFPITDGPRQISHHGVANLRTQCVASLVPASTIDAASVDAMNATEATQITGGLIAPRAAEPSTLPTIFHMTHWKAGSQWIYKILRAAAPGRIIAPEVEEAQFLHRAIQPGGIYPTVYVTYQQFRGVRPPENSRHFVVVRDLRDTLVSAYFSFKISHGNVGQAFMDLRHRLETLDYHAGMMYLMEEWLPRCARIQLSWLDSGEELIHYHDLLENDLPIMRSVLLDKCQLPLLPSELDRIVLANRFESIAGRPRGQEDINAHERKGVAGDWRNHFDARIKKAFKDRFGGVLIAMGFENGFDW